MVDDLGQYDYRLSAQPEREVRKMPITI